MNNKKSWIVLSGFLIVICLSLFMRQQGSVHAADNNRGLVDGSPSFHSACSSPDNTDNGGYDDAVDYNDNICSGQSSTWIYKNGYVYWSTKSKVATNQKATLYRTIGWDITFFADLNHDGIIGENEQITIEVARTIGGEYYSNMNYYYIHHRQKETDGILYNYSLYAMSYDRLQELAMNHEAKENDGKTPIADAIFSTNRVVISIDAIMITIERDAKGNENPSGYVKSEDGTSRQGVSAYASGTIKTEGKIYRCRDEKDYNYLMEHFNGASIATYKNSGVAVNFKITLEYYLDEATYGFSASNGWSVNRNTGQIFYNGKPYTEEWYYWEARRIKDFKSQISGIGYKLTGWWRCGRGDCMISDENIYHTSYLARYAEYKPIGANIYTGNGTLKLYADSEPSWRANDYTIEYYSKMKADSNEYVLVGKQECEYGKSYQYYYSSNTSAPVQNGVKLLYWTDTVDGSGQKKLCGSTFSSDDYPKVKKTTGYVIKMYAIWGIQPYTITCNENQPAGDAVLHQFYEIYGVGFTTHKALAETVKSSNPFYWSKSKYLIDADEISLSVPTYNKYIWNGYWDKKQERQFILSNGSMLFSSSETFEKNTTIYGKWEKNYSLTIHYKLGKQVTVTNNKNGYGVDKNGYLTINGKTATFHYLATDSVEVLEVPSCVKKDGCTTEKKWWIKDSSDFLTGGRTYAAKTLAKKAGGDLTKENVVVELELPWSLFEYYVDYYMWNSSRNKYEIKATQDCQYGKTYCFFSEKNTEASVIPDGSVFKGWNKKESQSSVDYLPGEKFKNLCEKAGGRISLYGVWQPQTYQIDLNGNCPSDAIQAVKMGTTQISYVYGKGFCNPELGNAVQSYCRIQIPSCEGYVFSGYYDQQKGGKQMIDATGKSTGNLSVSMPGRTFYAQWSQKTYRISYYANGGSFPKTSFGNEQMIAKEGIPYGTFLPSVIAPTKEGYSFDGYRLESESGEEWYNRFLNAGNRRYLLTQDANVYAKWLDDIVPTGTIRANAGSSKGAWTNQTVQLSVNGSDAGSGVVKMQLYQKRYYENEYQLVEEWTTSPVKSISRTRLVDTNGISSFYCVIYDARGNTNYRILGTDSNVTNINTTSIYMDKTAPKITAPIIEAFRVGDQVAKVSLYASDDAIE